MPAEPFAACRHEVICPARAEDAGVEAGHDVAAVLFERNWRHGHGDSAVSNSTSASILPDW